MRSTLGQLRIWHFWMSLLFGLFSTYTALSSFFWPTRWAHTVTDNFPLPHYFCDYILSELIGVWMDRTVIFLKYVFGKSFLSIHPDLLTFCLDLSSSFRWVLLSTQYSIEVPIALSGTLAVVDTEILILLCAGNCYGIKSL